jgi:transcriptional regulator with XRE-family HTH domain
MRDWQAIVAKNVRKLRQQRKLTQEQLAFAAEIDLTYLGGIERGRRNPSLLVMARIAEALRVPLPKLLTTD